MLSSADDHWFWRLIGLDVYDGIDKGSAVNVGIYDRTTMRFYQHYMVEQIKNLDALLLAAEMGLGKSVAVLTAIRDLLDEGKVERPILIVAPLLVAQETWPEEIEKWEHTRSLTWTLIRAEDDDDDVIEACNAAARGARAFARLEGQDAETAAKVASSVGARMRAKIKERIRREKMEQQTDIHIINRELLTWLRKAWGGRWPYKMLVYDEASRLKSGKKRTAKATKLKKDGTLGAGRRMSEFGTLAVLRPFFDRVVELSGTPSPNGLQDLWGPFYILDRGERLGTSKDAFLARWFEQNRWSHKIEAHEHSFDEIMGRVSDIMISMKEEDYLELPPRIDNPVYVDLPASVMTAYKRFERTLYLEEFDIEAISSGVLTNKLLQFANGSVYDENGNDKFVHDLKIRALESIVEEANHEPILVAYSFKFDLAAIRARWPKAVLVGEKDWKARWNRGEIEMLICHPASAGHGLNIQFGGSIGVWYGMPWSLELYLQFIKRLHRSGQRADRVWMHHILARNTADQDVFEAVGEKGATQARITDVVRVRLQNAA